MNDKNNNVSFIAGGISVDDRGSVTFCNEFDMTGIRRFYKVTNHRSDFVRAWHGHEYESKYLFVSRGAAMVATVRVEDWSHPNPEAEVEKHVLSREQPGLLLVPGGYAHGYKTLTNDTELIVFSSSTIEDSVNDDYRFESKFWNVWETIER